MSFPVWFMVQLQSFVVVCMYLFIKMWSFLFRCDGEYSIFNLVNILLPSMERVRLTSPIFGKSTTLSYSYDRRFFDEAISTLWLLKFLLVCCSNLWKGKFYMVTFSFLLFHIYFLNSRGNLKLSSFPCCRQSVKFLVNLSNYFN